VPFSPDPFDRSNHDGRLDCADADSLVAGIASGAHIPAFDLTGDGLVNGNDMNRWLAAAGAVNLPSVQAYLPGDANLDGTVDGSEFTLGNRHKFTSVAAWCRGDFTADGVVDGLDFTVWNTHKFESATATNLVPEPVGTGPVILALLLGFARRRKSQPR
jgi:hypothetical protein